MEGNVIAPFSAVAAWLLLAGGVVAEADHSLSRSRAIPDEDTIVRSFFPLYSDHPSAVFGGQEIFFFNVSAVTGDEEISRAKLHLHRRQMTKQPPKSRDRQLLPSPCRVVLHQARFVESRPRRLCSLPVSCVTRGGWMSLDVTAALRELHGRPSLLGVRFEAPKGVRLTIHNFLKHTKQKKGKSPAYLIILSKSDLEEGLDEPKERHLKHKERKVDHNKTPNELRRLPAATEVRHRSKHKVYEVRRSKEAEQELRRRTHLQSLPFLHVNEVADMRRSLRKAKRSILLQGVKSVGKSSPHKRAPDGNNVSEEGAEGCCRSIDEVPLTVVMDDQNNGLALHKLPGQNNQHCFCAPCD